MKKWLFSFGSLLLVIGAVTLGFSIEDLGIMEGASLGLLIIGGVFMGIPIGDNS